MTYTIDYGTGYRRELRAVSQEQAEAFAASERAILRNPAVRVCSRDDDPTQHDRRADLAPSPSMNTQHAPTLGDACRCYECRIARIPASPFVRRALSAKLPAKVLAR